MTAGAVLFDLQGAQSLDHRERGVARYVVELASALEAMSPSLMGRYLVNPDLPPPGGVEPLVASGKIAFVDAPSAYDGGGLLHVASPYELSIGVDRLLPPSARGLPLAVTLFDLIPETMADVYLEDPGLRRRYRARHELVRQADLVLAISEHVSLEVARVLGVRESRVRAVELAPSAGFRPGAVVGALPADRYVLYTGGSDGRKNVEGLLEGWAKLPASVRKRWKLVLACHVPPLQRNHFEVRAEQLGFGRGLVVTGWVPEPTLVDLYRGADLFVFPSLAEGFGLPVAEALACGTPAIASDRTSLPELLPTDALFDPTDPSAIARAIERALTDRHHRDRLRAWAARPPRTWADVARETLSAYESVMEP
ncbi:MAG: hypothetical protein QOF60_538 [Actinomycetota bacterium]|nr:hypothetical protein [Actinomycetota bacterium]